VQAEPHAAPLGARTTLRDYQALAVTQALQALSRDPRARPLVVAPTGAGKTVIAGEIARAFLEGGVLSSRHLPISEGGAAGRVLFIAHTREIIHQTLRRFRATGIDAGVYMGADRSDRSAAAQVASVQTLSARVGRGGSWLPSADLVILDEAHHARASQYARVLAHYCGEPGGVDRARVVGLTATPVRGDGRGMGDVFSQLVTTVDVRDLIDAGHLAAYRYWVGVPPDLAGLKIRHGDYEHDSLAERMVRSAAIDSVVAQYIRLLRAGPGEARRTTLAFCVTVAHSQALVAALVAAGVDAVHVDGTTPAPDRAAIFAALAGREVELVSNVALVSEGYDCPSLDGVLLCRPTKSLALARQQVGRVLRPPGPVVIVDCAGIWAEHGPPAQRIRWRLTRDVRGYEVEGVELEKSCPGCGELIPMRATDHAVCGWVQEKLAQLPFDDLPSQRMVAVEVADDYARGEPAREDWMFALLRLAHRANRKMWSVLYTYETAFGVKPSFASVRRVMDRYRISVSLALVMQGKACPRPDEECRFCDSVAEYWRKQAGFRAAAKAKSIEKLRVAPDAQDTAL